LVRLVDSKGVIETKGLVLPDKPSTISLASKENGTHWNVSMDTVFLLSRMMNCKIY